MPGQPLPGRRSPLRAVVLGLVTVCALWHHGSATWSVCRPFSGSLADHTYATCHLTGPAAESSAARQGQATGLAAIPVVTHPSAISPHALETIRWLFTSCVGSGPLKMGLPGLAAQFFFFAPLIEMRKIFKEKTTAKLPMLPFSAMLVNGAMWMAYGLLSNEAAIWVPNISSLLMGTIYTIIFSIYVPAKADWLPRTRNWHLGAIFALVAATSAAFLPHWDQSHAATCVGYVACAICVIMFSGPLTAISTVIKEKSTQSLPFPTTVCTVVNCSLWTFYGLVLIHDPFVFVPNIMGLTAGLVQLSLFLKFGFADARAKQPVNA